MDRNKTYFVKGISNDPYFNLASEEYLLRNTSKHYIYIWINSPAVIVGVNQNAAEEADLVYAEQNGIKVVRRNTGGGAVYHDLKNICYTIIDDFDATADNYRKFTAGITGYLNSLGVNAVFSGRNDVTVDGMKISGNAQCVYKNRIMHHGTLLFDTDKEVLTAVLKPHRLKVESKGIKSIRARIANIKDFLPEGFTAEKFFNGLCEYLSAGTEPYSFSAEDISCIERLIKEKYSTFEWNIGESPKGVFSAENKFPYGLVKVNFDVEKGALSSVRITGDFFSQKEISALNHALNGVLYKPSDVERALFAVGEYIIGASPEEIAALFFN